MREETREEENREDQRVMTHDFVTRLVFLVFMFVFVRTRRDIRVVFLTFTIALYAAIPSALGNWMSGNLVRGFRAAANVTLGANPNKLAMICLMEVLRPLPRQSVKSGVLITGAPPYTTAGRHRGRPKSCHCDRDVEWVPVLNPPL